MFASLVCMFCMFRDVVCSLTWCMWQCPLFTNLHQFAKRLIFGSCRHAPHAIFKRFTKLHNHGLHLGFIKDTEVRMGGAHIVICWLLQLKNALQATINSPEFIALRQFKEEIYNLQSEDFWNYVFSMCHALYAPMRVLRLADQKVAAMDKVHFMFVRQMQICHTILQKR
jgi:hypothetical protein